MSVAAVGSEGTRGGRSLAGSSPQTIYGAGGPASCDATLETHIIEYYAGCAFYELRTHTHTR